MFFSPFDLAPYIQPDKYLTCCISSTCCLLAPSAGRVRRAKEGNTCQCHTELWQVIWKESIHPSGEVNSAAQAGDCTRLSRVKMRENNFGVEWHCKFRKYRLKRTLKVHMSQLIDVHVSVVYFSSQKSIKCISLLLFNKSVLITRVCSSPDSNQDIAMLCTHFPSHPQATLILWTRGSSKPSWYFKNFNVL